MNSKNTKCANIKCQTTQTPLWRKGWQLPSGRHVRLCNACGLHYKKKHFCPYCNQVYRESEGDDPQNPWVGCDSCHRWVHRSCEATLGSGPVSGTYLCPDCRTDNPKPATQIVSPNSPSRKRSANEVSVSRLPLKKRPRTTKTSPWVSQRTNISKQVDQMLRKCSNPTSSKVVLPSFKQLDATLPEQHDTMDRDSGLYLLSPYKHFPKQGPTIDRESVMEQLKRLSSHPSKLDCLSAVCESQRSTPSFSH